MHLTIQPGFQRNRTHGKNPDVGNKGKEVDVFCPNRSPTARRGQPRYIGLFQAGLAPIERWRITVRLMLQSPQ
jgi:hypothetical protein